MLGGMLWMVATVHPIDHESHLLRVSQTGATVPQAVAAALAAQSQPSSTPGPSTFERATRSGFVPIASTLSFGEPTDIASGWDGSLWAIDAAGAPHTFDPVQNRWTAFGSGIDAACVFNGVRYVFRGAEVFVADGTQTAPQPIGGRWPSLPTSFKLGVQGAAAVGASLYLFRGGLYTVATTSPAEATPTPPAPVQGPAALTGLSGWPQTASWRDGVIDAVLSDGTTSIRLFRGAEYITVDFARSQVVAGPAPISQLPGWQGRLPADWATSGIDAAFVSGGQVTVHKGPAVVTFATSGPSTDGMAQPQYVAAAWKDWPVTWNAVLRQAPRGRIGGLWTATATDGAILRHDGTGWTQTPGKAVSIDAGVDGSVFCIGVPPAQYGLFKWDGSAWQGVARAARQLSQVAVGDASRVWTRDEANTVQRLDGNHLAAAPLVPAATYLAANADGTLWSCDGSGPNAFRFI